MANTYLSRSTASGTDTVWTWSGWLKRSKLGTSQTFFGTGNGSSADNSLQIRFSDDDTLDYRNFVSNSYNGRLSGGRKYRDTSAWYHFVFVWDTTQASGGNRMKAYVNGELITGFTDIRDPSQNSSAHTSGSSTFIGTDGYGGSTYFDGSLSHVHFIDGTAYDASAFGETDATTGEWKINTDVSVTYGTNGFFILKDGNSVTDQSGQGNDFTVGGGTLTKTEDSPSNVFATWNPLSPNDAVTYSYGNGVVTGSNATNYSMSTVGTLGASSGKYYWEMKYSSAGNANECVGVVNLDNYEYNQNITSGTGGYVSLRWDGEREINGATTSSYFTPPSTGAVIMCAMDMDNGKVFFGSNGSWFGSGNPVTGANPTADILTSGTWSPVIRYLTSKWECNFGNGYFADNTVSSAGTNASGIGIFEYDVPTGFTALSTKGLNL